MDAKVYERLEALAASLTGPQCKECGAQATDIAAILKHVAQLEWSLLEDTAFLYAGADQPTEYEWSEARKDLYEEGLLRYESPTQPIDISTRRKRPRQ